MKSQTQMSPEIWNEFWRSLRVGECAQKGNMQLFPLNHALKPALDYLTLEQALKIGKVHQFRVEEISTSGSVNNLKVVNDLESPVILFEGEILLGAKQNRTIHTTIIVDRKSEVTIPVACVESGRWSRFFREGFSVSNAYAHASLRYSKLNHLSQVRAASGPAAARDIRSAYAVNQCAVWDDVARFAARGEAHSETSDAEEVYRTFRESEANWHEFDCPRDASGIAVAIDGRLVGVECFDRPGVLQKVFPRMIQSYVSESMLRERETDLHPAAKAPATGEQVLSFLKEVAASKVDSAPGVGLGEDLRARGAGWTAAVLICRGGVLHGQALRANERPDGSEDRSADGFPPGCAR